MDDTGFEWPPTVNPSEFPMETVAKIEKKKIINKEWNFTGSLAEFFFVHLQLFSSWSIRIQCFEEGCLIQRLQKRDRPKSGSQNGPASAVRWTPKVPIFQDAHPFFGRSMRLPYAYTSCVCRMQSNLEKQNLSRAEHFQSPFRPSQGPSSTETCPQRIFGAILFSWVLTAPPTFRPRNLFITEFWYKSRDLFG